MKKIIIILLNVLIMLSLIGCTSQDASKDFNGNKIYLAELTEDEKNIIELLGVESEIDIYQYDIDDIYNSISIWIETYDKGILISNDKRINSQIDSTDGKIAVSVDKASNYKWRISHQAASGLSSCSFETNNNFETNKEFSIGSGSLSGPVEIKPDHEIVLKAILFDDGNDMSIYVSEHYVENPEVLKEYDYAYLIKCQFSKKTIGEINNQK